MQSENYQDKYSIAYDRLQNTYQYNFNNSFEGGNNNEAIETVI